MLLPHQRLRALELRGQQLLGKYGNKILCYFPDSDTRHNQWDTFQGNIPTKRIDEPLDTIASQYLGLIYSETWYVWTNKLL